MLSNVISTKKYKNVHIWTHSASPRTLDGAEAHKGWGSARWVRQDRSIGILRSLIVIDLEVAMCTGATSMDDTLYSIMSMVYAL